MKKSIIIFTVLAITVFGVGYLVFCWKVNPEVKSKTDTSIEKTAKMPGDQKANQEETGPMKSDCFEVISITGLVERKNNNGQWTLVSAGDKLHVDETIKTAPNATAKLAVNDSSEIDLAHTSELTVREIAEAVHRLNLVSGRIQVDYDSDAERVLNISVNKSNAIVQTNAGNFGLQSSDSVVVVATSSGKVKLTAEHKSVNVGPGQSSKVLPGQAPDPATPIPVSVMLRVAKLQRRVQIERSTMVNGQTSVGARVFINRIPINVNREGKFKVRVPLETGNNEIFVVAEDALGNTKSKTLPKIIVNPVKPKNQLDGAEVRWGKRNKKTQQ